MQASAGQPLGDDRRITCSGRELVWWQPGHVARNRPGGGVVRVYGGSSATYGRIMTGAVNILWTAGWDSTFRVAQLLLEEGRAVRPVYVWDEDRLSSKKELQSQDRIRRALIAMDPGVAHRLLPTTVYRLSSIAANPTITARWRALASRSFLGRQIDWLARMAEQHDLILEVGIHRDDNAHVLLEGAVRRRDDGVYELADVSDDALRVYERLLFPLFDVSKVEMEAYARKAGFAHVMEMTWFCATPLLDGRPCGYCNPCTYTRDEGMGRRVPDSTPLRRAQYLVLSQAVRVKAGVKDRVREFRARRAG